MDYDQEISKKNQKCPVKLVWVGSKKKGSGGFCFDHMMFKIGGKRTKIKVSLKRRKTFKLHSTGPLERSIAFNPPTWFP